MISGIVFGLLAGPAFGVLAGVLFGVPIGLARGGYAGLSHLALRIVLWRSSALPWQIARFLDYCAERIFLRKVGGGYIFVHRLLMEHFASLHEKPAEER